MTITDVQIGDIVSTRGGGLLTSDRGIVVSAKIPNRDEDLFTVVRAVHGDGESGSGWSISGAMGTDRPDLTEGPLAEVLASPGLRFWNLRHAHIARRDHRVSELSAPMQDFHRNLMTAMGPSVGDIVTLSGGGRGIVVLPPADRLGLVIRLDAGGWQLARSSLSTRERPESEQRMVEWLIATYPRERGWWMDPSTIREVVPYDRAILTTEQELLHRAIVTHAYGSEPVLYCTHRRHPMTLHRHSVDGGVIRHRQPTSVPMNAPLPGLHSRDRRQINPRPELGATTTTEESSTMTSTETTTEISLPLLQRNLSRNSSIVLTSKPGEAQADGSIVFGCQRFTPTELRTALATIEYTAADRAKVTAIGRVDAFVETITVAGHRLSLGEVSEYVEKVTTAPAEQMNGVRLPAGFLGCSNHPGETLFLLRNEGDVPVMGKVANTASGNPRPTGCVGVTTGFYEPLLRTCVPVVGSTTAQTMRLTTEQAHYSVPVPADRIEAFREAGLDLVAMGSDQRRIA